MLTGVRIDLDGSFTTVHIEDTNGDTRRAGIRDTIGCDLFDVIRLPENVDLWVDDEGLYMSEFNAELTGMVRLHEPHGAVFGRGLFLGHTQAGETVSLTVEQTVEVVRWWNRAIAGRLPVLHLAVS